MFGTEMICDSRNRDYNFQIARCNSIDPYRDSNKLSEVQSKQQEIQFSNRIQQVY